MYRVLVLLSILAASAQTTLSSAQECTTSCASCCQASCGGCNSCCQSSCGGYNDFGGWLGDDILTRDRLFGDVFGPKSCLAEHGIVTDFVLGQYYQGVTTGGNEQTDAYGGKVDMYFNVLGKALGLNDGFALSMHAETRFGTDVSEEAGSLTLPNAPMYWPLPGDYSGTNITGLMISQQIFDGKAGLVAGKLNTLDLVQAIMPEIGSGRESFMNVNALVTALPWFRFVNLSEWGAGIWTYDEEAGGQIQHGFIAFGLANASDNWDVARQFEDGAGMLGWLRFFHEIDGKPGWVAVFVGGATREYRSSDPSDWLIVPNEGLVSTAQKMPIGVAPYASQVLWQDRCNKARNIRLTVGGTIADDNPSFSNWNAFGKLEGFGLPRSRPGDRMGIAGWYNGISPNIKDITAAVPGGLAARDGWGLELYYNREITPWFHLSPDLQVLQNKR
jgi:porin